MKPDELRRLMDRHGVRTQRELAAMIGYHEVTVSRWVTGRTPISAACASLIREKLQNRKG